MCIRDSPSGPPLAVWTVLEEAETVDLETLARRSGLGPSEVAMAVTTLELGGYIARVPGVGVRRA